MAKEEIKEIKLAATGTLYQAKIAEIVSPLFKTKKEAETWIAETKKNLALK